MDLLVRRMPIERLVCQTSKDYHPRLHFRVQAVDGLHHAAEDYIGRILEE